MLRVLFILLASVFFVNSLMCLNATYRRTEGWEGPGKSRLQECGRNEEDRVNGGYCCYKHMPNPDFVYYGCRPRCPLQGDGQCTLSTCYCRNATGNCDPSNSPLYN